MAGDAASGERYQRVTRHALQSVACRTPPAAERRQQRAGDRAERVHAGKHREAAAAGSSSRRARAAAGSAPPMSTVGAEDQRCQHQAEHVAPARPRWSHRRRYVDRAHDHQGERRGGGTRRNAQRSRSRRAPARGCRRRGGRADTPDAEAAHEDGDTAADAGVEALNNQPHLAQPGDLVDERAGADPKSAAFARAGRRGGREGCPSEADLLGATAAAIRARARFPIATPPSESRPGVGILNRSPPSKRAARGLLAATGA